MIKCEACDINHLGSYGSGRFCSSKCARGYASRLNRIEKNENIRRGVILRNEILGKKPKSKTCKVCQKEFFGRKQQLTCSRTCSGRWHFHIDNPKRDANLQHAIVKGQLSVKSQSEKRRSRNEIEFCRLCESYFRSVLHNTRMFDGWDADVILPDHRIAVLWNGEWHFRKLASKHSVAQVQARDSIKVQMIKKSGFKVYIIEDRCQYKRQDWKAFVKRCFDDFIKEFNLCIECNTQVISPDVSSGDSDNP